MAKKLVDVEDLVVWATAELARKRPGKVQPLPVFNRRERDFDIVGKWDRPMGYPTISPMFSRGFAQAGPARGDPPHNDALVVEAAIERLRLTNPAPGIWLEADVVDGLGFPVDAEGALRAGFACASTLVLVHGRLGNRPALRLEAPECRPRPAANGKPGVWRRERWAEPVFGARPDSERDVEVAVTAKRKDLYPAGAYCVLEWDPGAQELVNERAEYAGWRAGLEWLAVELSDTLESRAALPPRAAARPWMGETDAPALRDFFTAGETAVYEGLEAATLAAERAAGRRRPVGGGGVYSTRPIRPGRGAREA